MIGNILANTAIFPRVECDTMARAVWFSYASSGHMPKAALCSIVNDTNSNMFACFPSTIKEKSMRKNWIKRNSYILVHQRRAPFYRRSRADIYMVNNYSTLRLLAEKPGDYGQMGLRGPYPPNDKGSIMYDYG